MRTCPRGGSGGWCSSGLIKLIVSPWRHDRPTVPGGRTTRLRANASRPVSTCPPARDLGHDGADLVDRDREPTFCAGALPCELVATAVFMATTSPDEFTNGPPELPGLMGAFVWIRPVRFSVVPLSVVAVSERFSAARCPRSPSGHRRARAHCLWQAHRRLAGPSWSSRSGRLAASAPHLRPARELCPLRHRFR